MKTPKQERMNDPRSLNWWMLPLLTVFLGGATGMNCGHHRSHTKTLAASAEVATIQEQDTGSWDHLPYFGFNAKGTLDVDQQTKYANDFLDQIGPAKIKKNLVVRVTAGTLSQLTFDKDWTSGMIQKWVGLQKRQGIRFIYVVNGNDTPSNQAAIIQKWLDAGAHFDFLEMMNEYYLPKYAKGDVSHREVREKISPEKYVDEILPAFWNDLDRFGLPYYLIFAPSKPGHKNSNDHLEHWNEVMENAMKNKYPGRQLNATIHLYVRGGADLDDFDYGQIDRVRNMMPAGRHIAVTEAGVIDPGLTYQQAGEAALTHYRQILKHLHAGDYLLDQVLYNASRKDNTAALNPASNGETLKGKAVLQFIQRRLQ
jgi:hypothetical protein